MTQEHTHISLAKIVRALEKIVLGIEKQQLEALEKELLKIYPTAESEVLLAADYDEEEKGMGIAIYVTHPQIVENSQVIPFDKLMLTYLTFADISKFNTLWNCLSLIENKSGDTYDLDFIPVFYTKEIDSFDLHFRITKK